MDDKRLLFESICEEAVSTYINWHGVIIRFDPQGIDKSLAADEMLQELLPKEYILFTGLHLPEVRKTFRQRGELWRIAPAPIHKDDFANIVENNRVQIHTDTQFYYNQHTGEHFLTYAEFIKIRSLLKTDKKCALDRVQEYSGPQ